MSEHRPDVERLLRAEMQRRAEGDDAAPVPADVVRRRALLLRRRRRGASAAGAVLAVAAIAVPLVVVGTRGGGTAPQPAPDPTTSEAASPSPTASTATDERDSVRDWVDALPAGRSPRIGYIAARTYVEPDGTQRTTGPNALFTGFVPYRGGVLGTGPCCFEGSQSLSVLGPELREVDDACTAGVPAMGVGGSRAYWSTGYCPESADPGRAQILSASVAGTETPLVQDVGQAAGRIVRMLGPVGPATDGTAPVAYEVFALAAGSPPATVAVTTFGGTPRPLTALEQGLDATHAGLVAGTSGRDLVVVDAASGAELWRVRDPVFEATFSPGAHCLVADDTVYDARTGEVLTTFDLRGAVTRPFWEDDTHLLVGVSSGRDVAVVRIDMEGRVERATDWLRGRDLGFEVLP